MPHGGVHQSGGKGLAIVKGDNVRILRGSRRLVQVAGCAALALGLASSAVATSGAASAAVADPARGCCTLPSRSLAVSWGANQYGQLGNGTFNENAFYGGAILTGVTQVAAGWDHSLALTSDGTVWAWGANTAGQLGNGSTAGSRLPEQVRA
jgi:Regulator of chromosome condensation (RCC1) repeat